MLRLRLPLVALALIALTAGSVLAQSFAPVAVGHPLLRGALAWWKAMPGRTGGDRFFDLLPLRLHCTLANVGYGTTSGWSATDRRGAAGQVNFDGSDDRCDAGQPAAATDIRLRTVLAWIKLTGFGSSNLGRIMSKRGPDVGWNFATNNNNVPNGISFVQDWSAGAVGNWCLASVITLNTWIHVGVTYDSTLPTNVPVFYINGVPLAPTLTVSSPTGTYVSDAASTLALGDEGDGARVMQGAMDDVLLYGRILAASDVQEIYRLGLTGEAWGLELERPGALAIAGTPPGNLGRFLPFFQ
jgi:hypothetical protein